MKIGFYVLILLVVAIVAGFVVTSPGLDLTLDKEPNNEPVDKPDDTLLEEPNFEELTAHFQDEIVTLGVSRVGQSIEGFNAFMLLRAFPGLLEKDFHGVESFEGVYEFTESELLYVRTKDQPITSAEDTVSNKGYGTLLQNVSLRVGIRVENEEQVGDLVDVLLLGEQDPITCAPELRGVDVCIEIYQPVCGLVNVQCVTQPCDPVFETFSNSCFACGNELVESYTIGECIAE